MRLLRLILPLLLLSTPAVGQSARPRVVNADDTGVTLEVSAIGYDMSKVTIGGIEYDRVTLDDAAFPDRPGEPAVPEVGGMVAVPFGVSVQVSVVDAHYQTFENVRLHPVPDVEVLGREPDVRGAVSYQEDPAIYSKDDFVPDAPALLTGLAMLRDQRVAMVSVRPIEYNPVQRVLRIAQKLTVRLSFLPDSSRPGVLPPALESVDHPFERGYRAALLNYDSSRRWRRRAPAALAMKQAGNWYDPLSDWYKIPIEEDGVYRLDAAWFDSTGIALSMGDLERLQIFVDGEEEPLLVRDDGDGVLSEGDEVLFYARFRRAPDRDFENMHGRSHIYWLRVGTTAGLRYVEEDVAPGENTPEVTSHLSSVHTEVDSLYERLGNAPDADRDHWFGPRTASPVSPGETQFDVVREVALPGLVTTGGGIAAGRVGMHGLSSRSAIDPDHCTQVLVNETILVSQDEWDGSVAFIASGEVPAEGLTDTILVTLATPGDPSYFPDDPNAVRYIENVMFNWAEVTYPRSFEVLDGLLTFGLESLSVETPGAITVTNLEGNSVTILDRNRGATLTNASFESEGAGFSARFAARSNGPFVAFEDRTIRPTPIGQLDVASNLRGERQGASYVVVTHEMFASQSEQLAEHRRAGGLTATVIDVQDVFDEFADGHLTETAIRDFMLHAYDNWAERPVYLMLMGRHTFDYRDLLGEAENGTRVLVPGMRFQSVRRGIAYTDHFFGTVSGDDSLMDVWVGRFSLNNETEANTVVRKVMDYDEVPTARWRDRVLYMANWDALEGEHLFIRDSENLIEQFTEPFGLETLRVYHDADTPPPPNESSSEVIRQINEGRLIVNFMGHGSVAAMAGFIIGKSQQIGFDYTGQIQNRDTLPLVIGMSCLNALYSEPTLACFAEELTNKDDGGAIAYISASSLAFIFTNNLMNNSMFRLIFQEGVTEFGAAVALAKNDLLTQRPGSEKSTVMMTLIGDPAQHLKLPEGPDYSIDEASLTITPEAPLAASDSAIVSIDIRNEGILTETPVEMLMTDINLDQGTTDTLFSGSLPPFGQSEKLTVGWPLSGRAGRHRLDVLIDPASNTGDIDPLDNGVSRVVEVFGALSALPLFPVESQGVSQNELSLGIRSGSMDASSLTGEFEISRSQAFDDEVIRSGLVRWSDGFVTHTPAVLEDGIWYWRGRLHDGNSAGAWTLPRSFSFSGDVPDREVVWRQTPEQIQTNNTIETYPDGSLGRTTEPVPLRLDAEHREAFFDAEGTPATAILATDGNFIYATGFFSFANLYPFPPTFVRIGTGLNGTIAGQNLGPVTDVPVETTSAAYHSDGFLYADIRLSGEILRIDPATGDVERVTVPAGLVEVETGLPIDGTSLVASDGKEFFNVGWGGDGVVRGGWTVRVFQPEEDWRLVRSFEVEPTETGFAYQFTDGVIADGRYLYLVEFGTGMTHRVRVVSAVDGSFVDEYESDQAETDLLSGQYDWVNDKVWMGQLNGPGILRYSGLQAPDEGIILSSPIGPAISWGSSQVDVIGTNGQAAIDVLGEVPGGAFVEIASLVGLPPGALDLSGVGSTVDRLRLRLRLSAPGLDRTPSLGTWEVRYQPVSVIRLSNLTQSATSVFELDPIDLSVDVQNLGPTDLVFGTTVGFYAGPPVSGRLIVREAIPEATPIGSRRTLAVRWDTGEFPGIHTVTAQVEDLQGRSQFFSTRLEADEPIEVIGSDDRSPPSIEISAQDAQGEVRPEDYLTSSPSFRIVIRDSSGVDEQATTIDLRGQGDEGTQTLQLPSSIVTNPVSDPASFSFTYQPEAALVDDEYTLIVTSSDRVGNGPATKTLSFRVESDLAIERVLNYPNPVAGPTAFTFVLSRPADVTVRVFTLAGRLIRVLDTPSRGVGYNQILWDGFDSDGHRPANGTYLYTITAETADETVRAKEKLIVYR